MAVPVPNDVQLIFNSRAVTYRGVTLASYARPARLCELSAC